MGLQTAKFQDKEKGLSTVNLSVFKVVNLASGNPTKTLITTHSSKVHMYSMAGGSGKKRMKQNIWGFYFSWGQ